MGYRESLIAAVLIEIISEGNTRAELARKRREYFHAGGSLAWMVDSLRRTVAVDASINESTVVPEEESLGGGDVLPGLTIPIADVFAVLDRAEGGCQSHQETIRKGAGDPFSDRF